MSDRAKRIEDAARVVVAKLYYANGPGGHELNDLRAALAEARDMLVTLEAVRWMPTGNGCQQGGWPRSKAWAAAKTWKVSAVDSTLQLVRPPGALWQTVKRGDWILRGPDGSFYTISHKTFLDHYEVDP